MGLYFLPIFPHSISHGLEDIGMLAGVDGRHHHIFNELEFLHGKGFVQVLLLDILLDFVVADGVELEISCTEEHSGRVIIFIVCDVHCVVAEVFLPNFLLFCFR